MYAKSNIVCNKQPAQKYDLTVQADSLWIKLRRKRIA